MRARLADIALQYASYHTGDACVLSYLQRLSCILNNRHQDTLCHMVTTHHNASFCHSFGGNGQCRHFSDRASDQAPGQRAVSEHFQAQEQKRLHDDASEAAAEEARQKAWDEEDDNDRLTTGPEGQGDLEPPSFLEVLGGAAASSITAVAVAGVGMITMLLLSNWVIQVVRNLKQQPANQEAIGSTPAKAGVSAPTTRDNLQATSTSNQAASSTQTTPDSAKSSQTDIKVVQPEQSDVSKKVSSTDRWWQRLSRWVGRKSRPVTQTTVNDATASHLNGISQAPQDPNPA